MLSICGTDFIACWAYEEGISAHAQPAVKCEHFYVYNPCWAYAERILSHTEHTGTNFIACWAYAESISSHAEHARKCLKVEYLGRIKYDFQKSRVTGPWDHKVSVSAKKVTKKCHACMELDLPSLFGLLCTAVLIGWDPATPPPPHLGSYTRALLVSQDRRHLLVIPSYTAIFQVYGSTGGNGRGGGFRGFRGGFRGGFGNRGSPRGRTGPRF